MSEKPTFMGVELERREITDKKEADVIRAENQDTYAQLEEEKRNLLDKTLTPEYNKEAENSGPPRTYEEFYRLVKSSLPFDTSAKVVAMEARRLFQRQPLIEKAVRDGLFHGRDLRERSDHGHGWWWDSLGDLTPFERGQVLRVVKAALKG